MKFSLEDVVLKYDAISNIMNDTSVTDVSLKYNLLTILHELEPHKKYFTKLRNELITRYGKLNEDGTYQIKEGGEHFDDYLKEINELLKSEVVIPDISKIKFDKVVNKLPNEQLLILYDFITEG